MAKTARTNKDKRVRISRFGCASALLFGDGEGGSVEIGLAPLEMLRLLSVWEEVEAARKRPDERVLAALRFLIPKTRTLAPHISAEVPIAATKRVKLVPDYDYVKADAEEPGAPPSA